MEQIEGKGLWLSTGRSCSTIPVGIYPSRRRPMLTIENSNHDWVLLSDEDVEPFADESTRLCVVMFSGDQIQEEIELGDGSQLLQHQYDGSYFSVLIFAVNPVDGAYAGSAVFKTLDNRVFELTGMGAEPKCEIPKLEKGIVYYLEDDTIQAGIFDFDMTGDSPYVLQGTEDDATARIIPFDPSTKNLLGAPTSQLILLGCRGHLLIADEEEDHGDDGKCGTPISFGKALALVGSNDAAKSPCGCEEELTQGCMRLANFIAFVLDAGDSPAEDRSISVDGYRCGQHIHYLIEKIGEMQPKLSVDGESVLSIDSQLRMEDTDAADGDEEFSPGYDTADRVLDLRTLMDLHMERGEPQK